MKITAEICEMIGMAFVIGGGGAIFISFLVLILSFLFPVKVAAQTVIC